MGRPVALSLNLPPDQHEMRLFAEKRLLQELQQLQLVRACIAAGGWSAAALPFACSC